RHFRTLHAVAADPGGPGSGIGKLRPPVFGPRRDRIQRQASNWGMYKLERAISLLVDTDLTLRSTANAPDMAVMERALLRLAWMGRT
ncbi:MAG: DNA polymerase III subunit delta, partial [Silicimonas sp.]|nr:DNA polymerase III subunit delta [Silicimonas sp.]